MDARPVTRECARSLTAGEPRRRPCAPPRTTVKGEVRVTLSVGIGQWRLLCAGGAHYRHALLRNEPRAVRRLSSGRRPSLRRDCRRLAGVEADTNDRVGKHDMDRSIRAEGTASRARRGGTMVTAERSIYTWSWWAQGGSCVMGCPAPLGHPPLGHSCSFRCSSVVAAIPTPVRPSSLL
jgi:hypothetical protein